jgi:hypothetical protein
MLYGCLFCSRKQAFRCEVSQQWRQLFTGDGKTFSHANLRRPRYPNVFLWRRGHELVPKLVWARLFSSFSRLFSSHQQILTQAMKPALLFTALLGCGAVAVSSAEVRTSQTNLVEAWARKTLFVP